MGRLSTPSTLIISSLVIAACQAQEDQETQSPRLISNENSAALTAGALGLGIGVAGSLIVSKLIDDAAKCKPPAIGKLFPDLLKFNPINPDCNRLFPQASNYRETYPAQYPSQGYQTLPLSSSYQPVPVQLTPSLSYQDQHTGFSQTSSHTARPDVVSQYQPSPTPLLPSVVEAYVYPDTPQPSSLSYLPNPAIQPRGLTDLFSPVSSETSQFTQTDPVTPHLNPVRTGKALAGLEARQVDGPVLFQPLTKKELDHKARVQSGFSQTEAVTPVTDTLRNGKSINSEAEILVEPREAGPSSQRLVTSSGFSETEAIVPEPDLARSVKQIKANSGRVLFKPSQEKLSRDGKSLSAVRKTEAKPFTKSLSDSGPQHRHQHPAVAVADVSLSELSHAPKSFSSGL